MGNNESTANDGGNDERTIFDAVEVEMPNGTDVCLADLQGDIQTAHRELEAYKHGALNMSQQLDELIIEYEMQGDHDAVQAIRAVKRDSMAVYLRLKRGDDELFGQRAGKYSGFLSAEQNDDPDPQVADD